MTASGQTITDRLLSAKHSIAGQGLAKAVCKATTEELIPPKKKHLDYLIHCTNEPNVSILQLANLLIERSQNTSWVVVFKALITTHHLMCYGNERFTQYLASSNCTFQISNFLDKTNPQAYEVTPFVRRYAKYLNEKALSYRTMAFDFCKVKRGKEDGTLRTMAADPLLKAFPVLQNQMDSVLEFDSSPDDIHRNSLMRGAFTLLFRDLIRLFATYNDAVINLLEKFFSMNKKNAREALDYYKKFLTRMDKVAEFLKVAEAVGIDKGEIPDLTKAPNSLLEALELHLASLEGRKLSNSSKQSSVDVSTFNSTSTAFIASDERQKILAEEEEALNQFKEKKSQSTTNPFLDSAPAPSSASQSSQQILDLFPPSNTSQNTHSTNGTHTSGSSASALDDLLSLDLGGNTSSVGSFATNGTTNAPAVAASNPFADIFSAQGSGIHQNQGGFGNAFGSGGAQIPVGMSQQQQSNLFQQAPSIQQPFGANTMNAVFGSNNDQARDGAPPPPPSTPQTSMKQTQQQPVDFFANVLTPQQSNIVGGVGAGGGGASQPQGGGKPLITGDLDSTLASLADSLTMKSNWTPSPAKTAKGGTGNPAVSSLFNQTQTRAFP